MSHWMRRLAEHYASVRRLHPHDRLLVVFDIDGTILDMRHLIRWVLLSYDRTHGTEHFHGLEIHDVDVHENQIEPLLTRNGVDGAEAQGVLTWYQEQRWQPQAVLAAHRPYRGVLDVIRWFQLQPGTEVGLNTGRPEFLREPTLQSLNVLGREYRVQFRSQLLHMNPTDWADDVTDVKVDGIRAFGELGYRVVAVIDNEGDNLRAMAYADPDGAVLFLHAQTLSESRRRPRRAVGGRDYKLAALIAEHDLPRHVQLVWHGLNDDANVQQFLASVIRWGECDVRRDPLDRVVLRHDSFENRPWSRAERPLLLDDCLRLLAANGRSVKLDLKEGGALVEATLELVQRHGLGDWQLWFNGCIETLGEDGFRRLASAHPEATLQCPVDFVAPLVLSAPDRARDVLAMLSGWGVNRFSISWTSPHPRLLFDRLDEWGYDVNIYAVPDLESFLQAVLLLPRSLTADFNFPEWNYFGRGSGERPQPAYGLERAS